MLVISCSVTDHPQTQWIKEPVMLTEFMCQGFDPGLAGMAYLCFLVAGASAGS